LASTVKELAERVEELETRVAPTATPTKTSTPIITPTVTTTPTVTPTPIPTADPDSVIVVQVARGNVRSGPGTQYDIVAVVESGDILQGPIQETSGWYQFCCVNEGETAWISGSLVSVQSREELSEWEAARSAAVEIDNEDLLRNMETHVGKHVYYKAYVVQALEDQVLVIPEDAARIQDVIWLIYENSSPRLIAEDYVEFVAEVIDLYSYETASYGMLTVPLLRVVEVRLIEE
jgi:SH3-like domain-containing protein